MIKTNTKVAVYVIYCILYIELLCRLVISQFYILEHSNSGKKVSIRFDSIPQSDKFAACTLIFK